MAMDAWSRSDRMNASDAVFWLMDKLPEMRSTIGVLLLLERAPCRERLRSEFDRLSNALVRMRQRVAEVPLNLAPPEWVEDPHFDLDYHVRFMGVAGPGRVDELLEQIGPLYATALDGDRPLWEAYAFDGLPAGRGAVFVKMHHCLVDGVGGSRLFESLLAARAEEQSEPVPTRTVPCATDPASRLLRGALYTAGEAGGAVGTVFDVVRAAVREPRRALAVVQRGLQMAGGFGMELTASRADSPLHDCRSLSRRLSTFDMSLTEIDAARHELGATNNDVVLTVVSGAMHRWHTSRGADVKELRALVPFNLRDATEENLGNRLALLAVSLPIGEPNPLRRLRLIQRSMEAIKVDRRARLYPALARLMLMLPLSVAQYIGRQQTQRANFVCTNVPGPQRVCYLAGERIERIYPYAPLVGDHPVSIALYSYGDTVGVGLDVDSMALRDIGHFRDALQEAYGELLNVASGATRLPSRRQHVATMARRAGA